MVDLVAAAVFRYLCASLDYCNKVSDFTCTDFVVNPPLLIIIQKCNHCNYIEIEPPSAVVNQLIFLQSA